MRSIEYEDFALLVEVDGNVGFKVRVLSSIYGGGEGPLQLSFPISEIPNILVELEEEIWRAGPPNKLSPNRDLVVATHHPARRGVLTEEIGSVLFEGLFPDSVLESYLLSRGNVEASQNKGLRLRIVINPDRPELLSLSSLPWELLYRKRRRDFFARNPLTPIVRHFDVTFTRQPADLDSGLRILVAMSHPKDLYPLDLKKEREWIESVWRGIDSVYVEFLEHATFKEVHCRLRDASFHVLHFMGHGHFDQGSGEGTLIFEDPQGWSDPLSGEIIAEHLSTIRSLRLVVLNACETASLPRFQGQSAYMGVASALVLRGIPAVIAMQFAISDEAAITFADSFYSAIASGLPVDAAVGEGRLAIFRHFPYSLAWSTPVLFSSVADGRLFSPPLSRYALESEPATTKVAMNTSPSYPHSEDNFLLFANREREFSRLQSVLAAHNEDRPRLEIWNSQPASGISYFLRQASRSFRKSAIAIYVDCALQVPNAVFSQIMLTLFNHYSELWRNFEHFTLTQAARGITQAGLSGIPYILPSRGSQPSVTVPEMATSHFPSAAAEVVCEFLATLKTVKILVLLDNVQDIDDWSLDLLKATSGKSYQQITYIMAAVRRSPASTDRLTRLSRDDFSIGYRSLTVDFPSPDAHLVQELATMYGLQLTSSAAEGLVTTTAGNIYEILKALEQSAKPYSSKVEIIPRYAELSPVEQQVVRLLAVACQGIRRSDILALCLRTDLLFIDHEYEIDQAIEALVNIQVVIATDLPDGDLLVVPIGVFSTMAETATGGLPYDLVTAEHLYTYFCRIQLLSGRHSLSEVVPLLYRLSKKVDPQATGSLIQSVIRLSLQMGSLSAAERFIRRATPEIDGKATNYEDFLVRTIFYLSLRSHGKALRFIEEHEGKGWEHYRVVSILHAIALNRSRHHKAADALLEKLLRTAESKEEGVLLVAYRIAGQIHMNNLEDAKNVFHEAWPRLSAAENAGYLLRNAASAFKSREALELQSQALERFTSQHDRFGYATTLANRAISLLSMGRHKKALEDATEAYNLLEIFGTHHLHIVINNLGLIEMRVSHYQEAEKLFWQALAISRTSLPTIYQKINLSAIYALTEREEEARRLLRDLGPDVEKHSFDRVRQKYYINAAVIMGLCGGALEEIQSLCAKALHHPDRKDRKVTEKKVDRLVSLLSNGKTIAAEEFQELWSPCSLSYWYQNPIEGLPAHLLTSKAVV